MISSDLRLTQRGVTNLDRTLDDLCVLNLDVNEIISESLSSWTQIRDKMEEKKGFLQTQESVLVIEPPGFASWKENVIHYEAKSGQVKGDKEAFVTLRFPFSIGGSTLQLQYGPIWPGKGSYLRSNLCKLVEPREIQVISGASSDDVDYPIGEIVTIDFSRVRFTVAPVPGIWYNTVSWFQLEGVEGGPSVPIPLTDVNTALGYERDKFATSFNPPLDIYKGDTHPWYYKEIPTRIKDCHELFFLRPWFEYYWERQGGILDIILGIYPYMVHKTYTNAIFSDLWTRQEVAGLIERLIDKNSKGRMKANSWLSILNRHIFKTGMSARIKCNCLAGYTDTFSLWMPDEYGAVSNFDMSTLLPKNIL